MGRFPLCLEAQGKGLVARVWGKGLVQIPQTKSVDYPVRTPLTYQGVGGCPKSDAATWFCWGDCVFVEGSAASRGFQARCIEDSSTVRAHCSDHEHQPGCKKLGNRGNLHGHCDHFGGEGDHQWPWTGGLDPGAYNT